MIRAAADVFFLILKVFSVYFAVVALFALLPRRRLPEPEGCLSFAVLIPARNEAGCIAGIVESLKAQRYPSDRFGIFVIPNNCTDDTEGAARRAGASVLTVSSAVRSKGAALREAMATLSAEGTWDAFCVFDADNEAAPDFLAAMNRTLQSGARVAKSRILAKNAAQGAVCACYEIYFCFANHFVNRAREALGLSARLIGTGFAVRRDALEALGGFRTETLTEDAEFYALCCAAGERIAYCEQAVTYDEEPLSFRLSMTQRMRWMGGIMTVTRRKLPALLRGLACPGRRLMCLDALMQLCFGFVQAVLPLALLGRILPAPDVFAAALPGLLLSWYLGSVAGAAAALTLQRRWRAAVVPGLLLYPLFMASFLPLQSISLFRRPSVWKPIPHTGVRLSADRPAA